MSLQPRGSYGVELTAFFVCEQIKEIGCMYSLKYTEIPEVYQKSLL
jgi:hypothetical protein